MSERSVATYYVPPRHYRDFRRSLAEIQRDVCPIAAKAGLKIHRIESIFDPSDPTIATGFEIEASEGEGADGKSENGSFFPIKDVLAAVVDRARQNLVNKEKTREAREQRMAELANYAERTEINGEVHIPPPLTPDDPSAPLPTPDDGEEAMRLELFDIERGRINIGKRWIPLADQVAEEFRETFRQSEWSPNTDGPLDLEQTRSLLELVALGAQRAKRLLDEPFHTDEELEEKSAQKASLSN
ncbi:hypothetical protein ACS8YF_18425 [Salinisphaera sp. SWV1]|uniref:hypothetical protein n=1 Tax=Salinisphaera sp. SWV1 TaxID=3454139 RepID=UPI003F83F096